MFLHCACKCVSDLLVLLTPSLPGFSGSRNPRGALWAPLSISFISKAREGKHGTTLCQHKGNRMMCLHGTYLVLRWSYSELKDENTAVFRCRWSDKIHTIFKTKKFFTWSKNACLYSRSRLTVTDQDDTSRISCKKRQSRLFHAQSPQRWRLCFGHTAYLTFEAVAIVTGIGWRT